MDTIFEIGGQDAKYTYLTNSVPSDYAMNEACSAGTGSFLEEAAKETLSVGFLEISEMALKGKRPPNFNDQCAAFISSDIKNAMHEGISKEDIVAGLVYSICMNYANRVKGNRPAGKKVFMQGGVCYNRAVPIAMAALTGKDIIVPPEPGLMGAFGVALEIKNRIGLGLLESQEFKLSELIGREVSYLKPFTCYGEKDLCDRKCEIAMIGIMGKKFPFGGACNKYYNLQTKTAGDSGTSIPAQTADEPSFEKDGIKDLPIDLVGLRQKLVFEKYADLKQPGNGKTVGITKSFLTNNYYPLYYNFFVKLGFKVVLSGSADQGGMDAIQSAFCYPAELAHGLFYDLVKRKVDYIFLPQVAEIADDNIDYYKKACVFVQSEPYYLRAAFSDIKLPELLTPVVNFSKGLRQEEKTFIALAQELGIGRPEAEEAYRYGVKKQEALFDEFSLIGKSVLDQIERKGNFAIILFGRPYNAFAEEANMGIPRKFSSRNITIIPFDFLPFSTGGPGQAYVLGDRRQPYESIPFYQEASFTIQLFRYEFQLRSGFIFTDLLPRYNGSQAVTDP